MVSSNIFLSMIVQQLVVIQVLWREGVLVQGGKVLLFSVVQVNLSFIPVNDSAHYSPIKPVS